MRKYLKRAAASVKKFYDTHEKTINDVRTFGWSNSGYFGMLALAGSLFFGVSDHVVVQNTGIGLVGGFLGGLAAYVINRLWLHPEKYGTSPG